MSDQPKTKREAPLSFRPLHGAASVRALAQAAGHTTNSFLNSCVYGPNAPRPRRVPSPDERTRAFLLIVRERARDGHQLLLVESRAEKALGLYRNDGPADVQAEFGRAANGQKTGLADIEGDFERASRGEDGQPQTTGEGTLLGHSRPPDYFSHGRDNSKSRDPERDRS